MKTHRPWSRYGLVLAVASCSARDAPPPLKPVPPPIAAAPASAPSAPEAPAAPPPEKLASDAARATPGGATFTAPKGWTLRTERGLAVLEAPEPGLVIAFWEGRGGDAVASVLAASQALRPGFSRPLKMVQATPGRHGWQERKRFVYETSPNEKLVVVALAHRAGDDWTVALAEGRTADVERRGAQVRLALDSLRPKGYAPESFAGKVAHPLDAARIEALRSMVERARELAGIPGVAVSLVQNGAVVLEAGFGVRELGKPARIDPDTLLLVASNTKALSTLLLAKLVDEGKLGWETPVTTVYREFKLGDADTTRRTLVKHLLCACTGVPRQDFEWLFEFARATPKSEMELLGTMQPTTGFGEVFQYSNVLASAAGFVGGFVLDPRRELGAAYDEAMRSRVFAPLGMARTTFDFARALRDPNHAAGHAEDVDGKTAVATVDVNRAVVPLRPAGGAWSSARDMRRYVQMELARGKLPDGKPYVSEAALLARRAPQVASGEDESYGMGLSIATKYGVTVVHHGGSLIGFKSDMFWLPDHGVGGVLLTNADTGGLLVRPFVRRLLELLFDGRPEAEEDFASAVVQRKERRAKDRERLVVPADPTLTADLAKGYTSPALGDVAVLASGGATVFDFGEWKSPVASRRNDDGTVSFVTIAPGVDGFTFVVGARDGKRTLVLRDMQHEYVFVER
jgi:CubicO group peptidase (beta-lactamase class C family)